MSYIVIAHNIRSAHNVGSLFRTADGTGVDKIFLTGYTPMPATKETIYLTRAHKDLAKTALGAEKNIVWEHREDVLALLKALKKDGYQIIALEQSEKSVDYRAYRPSKKIALIAGNEVRGVDADILDQCDAILEIPMRGQKNSLNVSVAFGIAAFEIRSKME
ncbi:MAG: RNA methyltransferase [Candidatus Moranbacteria bacterium]|nr:RNA methyltransferase [Candidatus Moranbacteria bacterium]